MSIVPSHCTELPQYTYAPMHTYAPVDYHLPAHLVAYVFEGEYAREFTPEVPLLAVLLCYRPDAPQTVGELLAPLPPLAQVRFFALHNGIVAYNGFLPPTFFAELLGYIITEWVEEREQPVTDGHRPDASPGLT